MKKNNGAAADALDAVVLFAGYCVGTHSEHHNCIDIQKYTERMQ